MKHFRRNRKQRGAALIYILAITAVLLLIFSTTFQSFHSLRQVNRHALTELQNRASALRLERPRNQPAILRSRTPGSQTDSE